MEEDLEKNVFFDFNKEPGKCLRNTCRINVPKISIITSYYNYKKFIMQTYRSINNQTFPYWEWIIINDGSTEKGTDKILNSLKSLDERIKVYNKENEGLAKGRDYGISKATTELIFPLDADDLIEPTTLECCYWALKTNPKAAWAYTNIVNFGEFNDLDNRKFDVEKMKYDNMITATALIRKNKIIELGGYSIAKRYVNEDWHLWLRMMQKGNYPVEIGFYGFWYRRKKKSLLTWINSKENINNEKRLQDINAEAKKINNDIIPKIYPDSLEKRNDLINDSIDVNYDEILLNKSKKEYLLVITNCLNADKFKINMLKDARKKYKNIVIITTEKLKYVYRQKYEDFCEVFDLTTFLDTKCWKSFVEYIINTRNVKKAYIINCEYEKDMERILKKFVDCNYETINYKENDELYYKEIEKYKKSRRILNRIIRKILKGC